MSTTSWTPIKRGPALELYFDICLGCKSEKLTECSCHEEGKGRE